MGLTVTHFIIIILCTIEDIRFRKISMSILLMGIPIGVMLHMFYRQLSIGSILAGFGLGLLIMFFSFLSGEKIGMGDGAVLAVSGLLLGWRKNAAILLISLFFTGIAAVVLLFRKKNGKYEIPFLPFLLLASLVVLYADFLPA